MVADEDGSAFLLSEVEALSFALCGVSGNGTNLLVLCKMLHGFLCWQRFAGRILGLAGAGECVRSMWDVRGRHGHWQEGGGGTVVADTAGES